MIMRLAKGTQYHSHYSHYLFQEGQTEGSGGPTFEALCETEMRIKKAVLNYYICQMSYVIILWRNTNQMFTKMTCVHVLCPISHPNPPKQFDPNASH